MQNFEVDDEKIKAIAESQATSLETVKRMNALYKTIADDMKLQYLAHVIRTVETQVRAALHSELFQIRCQPLAEDAKRLGLGLAQYYPNDCYIIYYHPLMDEKTLRMIIAHELGHLVVEVLLKKEDPNEGCSEPLSTIFGILSIMDKNDFYQNRASQYQHSTWQEIIAEFKLLRNESKGVANIS